MSIGRELNRENLYWLEKSYDTDFELGKIAGKLANEGNGQTIRLEPSHQKKFKKAKKFKVEKIGEFDLET